MSTATAGPTGLVHSGYFDVQSAGDLFADAPTIGPLEFGSPTLLPESTDAQWAVWRFVAPAGRYGVDVSLSDYKEVAKRGVEPFQAIYQVIRRSSGSDYFSANYIYGYRGAPPFYFNLLEDEELYVAAQFLTGGYQPVTGYSVPRFTESGSSDWIQLPDTSPILAFGDNFWLRQDACQSFLPGHLQLNNEGHSSGFRWYSTLYGPNPKDRIKAPDVTWLAARMYPEQGYVFYDADYGGVNQPWKGDPNVAPERPAVSSGGGGAGYIGWSMDWHGSLPFTPAAYAMWANGVIYSGRHQEILSRCGKLGRGINNRNGKSADDVSEFFDGPVASVEWEGGPKALPEMLEMWFRPDEAVTYLESGATERSGDYDGTVARWFFSQFAEVVLPYGPYADENHECKWSENGGAPEVWESSAGVTHLADYNGEVPFDWTPVPWQDAYQWDLDHGLIGPDAPEYVGYGGYVFSGLPEAIFDRGAPDIPGGQPDPVSTGEGSAGGHRGIGTMNLMVKVRPVRFRAALDAPVPDAEVVFPGMTGELGGLRRGFLPRR